VEGDGVTAIVLPPLVCRRRSFPWRDPPHPFVQRGISSSVGAGVFRSPAPLAHQSAMGTTLDADVSLMQAGITSIAAVRLSSRLRALTSVTLSPTLVFEQPTARAISSHLALATSTIDLCNVTSLVSVIQNELAQVSTITPATLSKSSVDTEAGVPADAQLQASSQQHQLLLHQQLQPKSTAYNEPVSISVGSHLAEPMARAALRVLVRRHAVLRTYFALDARTVAFHQVILLIDGSSIALACCSAPEMWGEDLYGQLRTPFDLLAAPPLRAIMLCSERSRLIINVHHVAADMEAMAIMRAEVVAHCAALAHHHRLPSLTPLAFEYADYALWEHVRGQDDSAALSWWYSQLQGASETLDLPLDLPRPNLQATAASHRVVQLDRALTGCVMALCASVGATLNSTLVAFWGALLHHLSGQTDVVIGLPHSMR
jgi:hypothetical protein